MIYTIVTETEFFRELSEKLNKRDCHSVWQPLNLIPESVTEYIWSGKSSEICLERLAAYSTLFFALFEIYGKEKINLCRTDSGKPYLTENGQPSEIRISISHSNGIVAVALSEEGELGVDIQGEIDEARAERLEKRFFRDVDIKEEKIDQKLLYLDFSGEDITLELLSENEENISEFTKKWSYAEALMKCDGGGFASIQSISKIQKQAKITSTVLRIKNNLYSLSTAIKST